MNTLKISKDKIRDYLSNRLANNILNSGIEDLATVLRYNALGGYDGLDDFDLFENLVAAHPELELLFLAESDEDSIYVAVKPQYKDDEDAVLIDMQRAIQIIV